MTFAEAATRYGLDPRHLGPDRQALDCIGVGLGPNAPEGSRAADDKVKFTFRGEPKPPLVPDAPLVDMAKDE